MVSRLSSYLSGVQERLRAAELARAAESARAEEAQARVAVERSRGRRTMALAASLLAMMGLGIVTFSYVAQVRQARTAAQERRLGRAATLVEQARDRPDDLLRWRTAEAAVQQVEDDPAGISVGVRDRFDRLKAEATSGLRDAERDATLLQVLVEVRANLADAGPEATDAAYARAFRGAGLDVDALSATEAARLLGHRPPPVAVELASFLDHWSGVRREAGRPPASWRKPMEFARAVDGDDYRDRLRNLLAADDRRAVAAQLKALADEPRAAQLPAATAVLLCLALQGEGEFEAAVGLLRQAVMRHPDDFWVNFALAVSLERLSPTSARGGGAVFFGGARPAAGHGARPGPRARQDGPGRRGRGHLSRPGRPPQPRHAGPDLPGRVPEEPRPGRRSESGPGPRDRRGSRDIEARPRPRRRSTTTSANALAARHQLAEAEAEFRAALKLNPDLARVHYNLGNALRDQGKPADAEAEFRASAEARPRPTPRPRTTSAPP